MRNVSENVVGKKHKFCAHFFIKNREVYGIRWKNILQTEGPQITI
jgi:hypothetical protein